MPAVAPSETSTSSLPSGVRIAPPTPHDAARALDSDAFLQRLRASGGKTLHVPMAGGGVSERLADTEGSAAQGARDAESRPPQSFGCRSLSHLDPTERQQRPRTSPRAAWAAVPRGRPARLGPSEPRDPSLTRADLVRISHQLSALTPERVPSSGGLAARASSLPIASHGAHSVGGAVISLNRFRGGGQGEPDDEEEEEEVVVVEEVVVEEEEEGGGGHRRTMPPRLLTELRGRSRRRRRADECG
ncbi:unnamed protein product [Lampetra fluviatilis]